MKTHKFTEKNATKETITPTVKPIKENKRSSTNKQSNCYGMQLAEKAEQESRSASNEYPGRKAKKQ